MMEAEKETMRFEYARQLFENSLDDLVFYLRSKNIDIKVNNDSVKNKIKNYYTYTVTIVERKK